MDRQGLWFMSVINTVGAVSAVSGAPSWPISGLAAMYMCFFRQQDACTQARGSGVRTFSSLCAANPQIFVVLSSPGNSTCPGGFKIASVPKPEVRANAGLAILFSLPIQDALCLFPRMALCPSLPRERTILAPRRLCTRRTCNDDSKKPPA